MDGISLILPAYNEADVIYETACESARALADIGCEHEIIVVDDGSVDNTALEADRAAREFQSIKVLRLAENQGKGNAMKRGFQASVYELVCFLDADLDLHPRQITRLLSVMDETGADIVIGSKRHPDSEVDYPRIRKVYSTIYYALGRLLFRLPIKDTQTGIKVFKREVLKSVFPRVVAKKYALDLELLVAADQAGYTVAEAPIKLDFQRQFGRINWTDVRNIVVDTMAVFYRLRILGYYGSPLKPNVDYEPTMSIVVPSRDLDPLTRECLEKSQRINYSNYDIKYIPDSPEVIELQPRGSEVIVSGHVGPAVKRNMGAAASNAEIIAFIDADAWPDHDWLKNAVPYFAEDCVAAVGGPAVTPADDSRKQAASGLVYSASMVSGSTTYRYTVHAFRRVDDYPTSNLLVRRSDFEAVGGFQEEFWPGEDTVLCLKLTHDLGKKIIYVPNVIVNHHRRALFRGHLRQVYSYSVHRGFFVRKFPETSRRIQYFVPSLFVIFLLAGLVASIFSSTLLISYLSVLGIYVLLTMVSSIKSLDPLVNLLVFPGIIATHVTYGFGFIKGLLSRKMKEQ
jgi:cellulose synthase/poly-beta-1,6-N-acetylglucosamine synthase-like glycosyltransferase